MRLQPHSLCHCERPLGRVAINRVEHSETFDCFGYRLAMTQVSVISSNQPRQTARHVRLPRSKRPQQLPIATEAQYVTKRNMTQHNTSKGRKALTFSRFCRYDSILNHRRGLDEKSFHDCATVRRVGICGKR